MGEATDRSKVSKSQCQEVVPKDLQDRAVSLESPLGQSADPKDPEDQEDAELAFTYLLSVQVPSSQDRSPKALKKRLRRFALIRYYFFALYAVDYLRAIMYTQPLGLLFGRGAGQAARPCI